MQNITEIQKCQQQKQTIAVKKKTNKQANYLNKHFSKPEMQRVSK